MYCKQIACIHMTYNVYKSATPLCVTRPKSREKWPGSRHAGLGARSARPAPFISRLHSFDFYNSIVSIQKMYKNLLRGACNSCANFRQADLARELHTTALIVLRAHLIYQSPCPPSELTSRLFKETAHSNHMAILEPVDRGPAPRTRGPGPEHGSSLELSWVI